MRKTADVVATAGGDCLIVPGDVTAEADAARMVTATLERFGGLDVLVNAAGIIAMGTVESTTLDDWDRMFAVNLRAPIVMSGPRRRGVQRASPNEAHALPYTPESTGTGASTSAS